MTVILGLLKSYWPQIAAFFFAVSVGFGMAWSIQGSRLDRLENTFQRYQNEVEQNAIKARRAALDKENFWRTEAENARINAQAREAQLKKDVAAAQFAGARMRDSIATLHVRLADAPGYACLEAATTLGNLLESCRAGYEKLGSEADGHVIDIEEMRARWPR